MKPASPTITPAPAASSTVVSIDEAARTLGVPAADVRFLLACGVLVGEPGSTELIRRESLAHFKAEVTAVLGAGEALEAGVRRVLQELRAAWDRALVEQGPTSSPETRLTELLPGVFELGRHPDGTLVIATSDVEGGPRTHEIPAIAERIARGNVRVLAVEGALLERWGVGRKASESGPAPAAVPFVGRPRPQAPAVGIRYLDFDETADFLQIDEEELKKLISQGELRGFRSGLSMKFKRDDVENLKQGRETEPTIVHDSDLTDSQQEELTLEDSTSGEVISIGEIIGDNRKSDASRPDSREPRGGLYAAPSGFDPFAGGDDRSYEPRLDEISQKMTSLSIGSTTPPPVEPSASDEVERHLRADSDDMESLGSTDDGVSSKMAELFVATLGGARPLDLAPESVKDRSETRRARVVYDLGDVPETDQFGAMAELTGASRNAPQPPPANPVPSAPPTGGVARPAFSMAPPPPPPPLPLTLKRMASPSRPAASASLTDAGVSVGSYRATPSGAPMAAPPRFMSPPPSVPMPVLQSAAAGKGGGLRSMASGMATSERAKAPAHVAKLAALSDSGEAAADKPVALGKEDDEPESFERKATVRYYSQMYARRNYPLLVVVSKRSIQKIVQQHVAQVEGKKAFTIRRGNPFVTVRPIIPGCLCVPAEITMNVKPKVAEAKFWVTPQAEGELAEARVEVLYEGKVVSTIDTPTRVTTQALAKASGAFAFFSTSAGPIFQTFGVSVKKVGAGMLADFLARIAEGGYAAHTVTAAFAFLALVFYMRRRPKAGPETEGFFDWGVEDAVEGDPLVRAVKAKLVVLGPEGRDVVDLIHGTTLIGSSETAHVRVRGARSLPPVAVELRYDDALGFVLRSKTGGVTVNGDDVRVEAEHRIGRDGTIELEGGKVSLWVMDLRPDPRLDDERRGIIEMLVAARPTFANELRALFNNLAAQPVRASLLAAMQAGQIDPQVWLRTRRTLKLV